MKNVILTQRNTYGVNYAIEYELSLWIEWQKGEIIIYFEQSQVGRVCGELIRCAFNSYMYYDLHHVALCVYVCIPSLFFFLSEVCIPSLLIGYYWQKNLWVCLLWKLKA